jgi:hypothetical protein
MFSFSNPWVNALQIQEFCHLSLFMEKKGITLELILLNALVYF